MLALLNPRVILILAVAIFVGALLFKIQGQKVVIATLKGDKAVLEQMAQDLGEQNTALTAALKAANDNLLTARKSLREMERIRAEANALRMKLAELEDKPLTCPELESKYEEISIDTAKYFNSYGVRGKVNRPDTSSDSAGGKVLQPPVAPSSTGN